MTAQSPSKPREVWVQFRWIERPGVWFPYVRKNKKNFSAKAACTLFREVIPDEIRVSKLNWGELEAAISMDDLDKAAFWFERIERESSGG